MAKRPKKIGKSQAKLQELVIVTFAEDLEQAKDYESLLKSNDIPVIIKEQDEESADTTALEEDDGSEFDGDLFEDDF